MKVLFFASKFEVGGTLINIFELASTIQQTRGCDVAIFATPGPLVEIAKERGIRFIPAPTVRRRPSLTMAKALMRTASKERPDLIHAWDWWQGLECYFGPYLMQRIPMVLTDMGSEDISTFLPKHVPTTFGTPEFVRRATFMGRCPVALLLPPVDIQSNTLDVVTPAPFKKQFRLRDDTCNIVTVSRIATMKAESLRRTILAVCSLRREMKVRLIIVGDGHLGAEFRSFASEVNLREGEEIITLTGEILDPRQAYASADVVIGMGGSALRALAFGKPLVVVGSNGFSKCFGQDTADEFYNIGFYGVGDGDEGNRQLINNIRTLVNSSTLTEISRFGRSFVEKNFSLQVVAEGMCKFYEQSLTRPRVFATVLDASRTATVFYGGIAKREALRQLARFRR